MDQFDREDSSSYVNEPQRPTTVQPEPVATHEPRPEPKQRKSKAAFVLSLLLLLALACAAIFGWLWYQQNGRVDNLESDLSAVRNKNAQLESSAKAEAAVDDTDITTETDNSDAANIIKAALQYEKARMSTTAGLKATVDKNSDGFSRVSISSPSTGSGAMSLYLKEVDSQWIVIGDTQDDFDELMADFGLPEALGE